NDLRNPAVHTGPALWRRRGQYQAAHQRRTNQGDFLRHEAADRKSKEVDPVEILAVEEGDGVTRHLRHGPRRGSARSAHTHVVEGDALPPRRQGVDQRGIPVVQIATEMLEQDQWCGALSSLAVGEVNAVGGGDHLVWRLPISSAAATR